MPRSCDSALGMSEPLSNIDYVATRHPGSSLLKGNDSTSTAAEWEPTAELEHIKRSTVDILSRISASTLPHLNEKLKQLLELSEAMIPPKEESPT